jgi:hypothetical protein
MQSRRVGQHGNRFRRKIQFVDGKQNRRGASVHRYRDPVVLLADTGATNSERCGFTSANKLSAMHAARQQAAADVTAIPDATSAEPPIEDHLSEHPLIDVTWLASREE